MRDHERTTEELDASDPDVSHWLLECGFLEAPVRFRLRATNAADLQKQIERIERAYGDEVRITAQAHNRAGNEHIAYGAFLR